MEDDDEFGDLYTDVLQNFSVPQPHGNYPAPAPSSLPRQIDLNLKSDPTPVASYPNSTPNDSSASQPQVREVHAPALAGDVNGVGKGGELAENDVKFDVEGGNNGVGLNDDVAVIPGIGSELAVKAEKNESKSGNGDVAAGEEEEDWDSDSEDDLQIVLNEENHRPMVIDEGGGDDDDDDDDEDGDPLVIVADVDANNQGLLMEEPDWGGAGAGGDETAAAGGVAEGGVEKKEGGDRLNGGVAGSVAVAGAKIGYSNHYGYHYPYHSQFKVSLLVS